MCFENQAVPVLQRMDNLFRIIINKQELYVPVRDNSLYTILKQEAARIAVQHEDPALLVILDGTTAKETNNFESIVQKARCAVLLDGEETTPWNSPDALACHFCAKPLHHNDRVLLLLSKTISLALFCQHAGDATDESIMGGWTVQRSTVMQIAQSLLGAQHEALLLAIPSASDIEDQISRTMMRLTTLHTNALKSREQSASVEKNDLLAILDILKAIASKRHAHDILFAFVEQIARVIPIDRCSIVRVWEGEAQGHVLVSHEEESLRDYAITLDKYPELTKVLDTGETLTINDVASHALTKNVSPILQKAGIAALLVLPIVQRDEHVGTLILRAARKHGTFSLREISFFQIVTEAAANALERAHLFESIQAANESLAQLAITDSLTGLYNRRYFHERFEHEFARATRYRLPFSCVIFDIDDFKKVNDTYGHLVGDSILRQVTDCVIACTRRVDILARYGGEEFVILLPQTDVHGASIEAERVCAVMRQHDFTQLPKGENITISVGVAGLDQAFMKESDDLLRAADTALYQAKNNGKNRVVVYQNLNKE